jgi:hypothetical protein
VVTVLRFLHVADPGYDLGIQLQAAHNLLAGHGLSTFEHVGPNLTDPARLETLTYFPAGYSLAAAALMALGLSMGTAIRVLGAAGTIGGWWGWGRLAHHFLTDGWKISTSWKVAASRSRWRPPCCSHRPGEERTSSCGPSCRGSWTA